MAIAAIGLYGLLAYSVSRRTREIGLRMALGAQRGDVAWLVLKEVVKLFAVGATLAVAASLGLTRFIESQLHGVSPWDPVNLSIATAVLAIVALAAGFWPNRSSFGPRTLAVSSPAAVSEDSRCVFVSPSC